jgi:hypothetical protein
MDDKRRTREPDVAETRRGEHNELHYYNADEEQTYDERGSQTEGPGESERGDADDRHGDADA